MGDEVLVGMAVINEPGNSKSSLGQGIRRDSSTGMPMSIIHT